MADYSEKIDILDRLQQAMERVPDDSLESFASSVANRVQWSINRRPNRNLRADLRKMSRQDLMAFTASKYLTKELNDRDRLKELRTRAIQLARFAWVEGPDPGGDAGRHIPKEITTWWEDDLHVCPEEADADGQAAMEIRLLSLAEDVAMQGGWDVDLLRDAIALEYDLEDEREGRERLLTMLRDPKNLWTAPCFPDVNEYLRRRALDPDLTFASDASDAAGRRKGVDGMYDGCILFVQQAAYLGCMDREDVRHAIDAMCREARRWSPSKHAGMYDGLMRWRTYASDWKKVESVEIDTWQFSMLSAPTPINPGALAEITDTIVRLMDAACGCLVTMLRVRPNVDSNAASRKIDLGDASKFPGLVRMANCPWGEGIKTALEKLQVWIEEENEN